MARNLHVRTISAWRFISLSLALLLITAARLPAPIQEIPESQTPAPQESVSQQKPKHSAKSKPKAEPREASNKRHESTQLTQIKARRPENQSRCAGVWTGMLSFGIVGTAEETLTIDPTGTVVLEKNQFGSATHPATWNGATVRFQAGALNEITFTLTPNGDGQTAVVTADSMFISNPGAAFRKIANYEASAGVGTSASTTAAASQKADEIPTAKPVPGRPGFVYNPFDPTATRLLDVRGKPSGTKLKDPVSGKLFIVP
jgi:hypothetical protein